MIKLINLSHWIAYSVANQCELFWSGGMTLTLKLTLHLDAYIDMYQYCILILAPLIIIFSCIL